MNKIDTMDTNVISVYTQEQAIEDGILTIVGTVGKIPVIFTTNLFYDGYEDKEKRLNLIKRGIDLLNKPDAEDDENMKLRVIEKDKIWVILNAEGITFMKPEDY